MNEKNHELEAESTVEVKLVRKVNWTTMPLLNMLQVVQLVDKATLNFSAMLGIFRDTGITMNQFSWLGATFYVGYLAAQIPNSLLMQRCEISKYIGLVLVSWGTILGCTTLCRTFPQLVGLRILLGAFEAPIYPCIFLLISTLYRRSEQVTWCSTIFISGEMATITGSLIMYSLGYIDGAHGISAWQWCMILWGSFTILLGLLCFVFLPDKPTSRWFRLSSIEKKIVEARVRDNVVVRNNEFKWEHIQEAVLEPRLYCYFLMSLFINLQNGCITVFMSQIISGMGFEHLDAILLGIPFSIVNAGFLALGMWLSRRQGEIAYIASLFLLIPFTGNILILTLPSGGSQLAGLYLCGSGPAYALVFTSVSNNVAGYTKKIFYNAVIMVAYCVGNFVGPLLMLEREKPRYPSAMITYAVATLLSAFIFLYLRWIVVQENRRRSRMRQRGDIPPPPENRQEMDLTDKEDLNFVYRT